MRNMVVRFLSEGNQDKRIEEGRNYFLAEAHHIVEDLKLDYKDQSFQKVVSIYFPNEELSFTRMMVLDEITDFNSFVYDNVHSEVSKSILEEVFTKESKLYEKVGYQSETFKSFMARYDYLLCGRENYPFPFLIDLKKMYGLFEAAFGTYGHLFFSNLEKVVRSVESLFHATLSILEANMNQPTKEELQTAFFRFVNNEEDFLKMQEYIKNHLVSLNYRQIGALYPKNRKYQLIEQVFFEKLPFYVSFEKSMKMHQQMVEDFYFVFHLDLFNGGQFLENYDFEKKVFNPVIDQNIQMVERIITELIQKNGYDEGEVNEILNIYKRRADVG